MNPLQLIKIKKELETGPRMCFYVVHNNSQESTDQQKEEDLLTLLFDKDKDFGFLDSLSLTEEEKEKIKKAAADRVKKIKSGKPFPFDVLSVTLALETCEETIKKIESTNIFHSWLEEIQF